jgi:NAD+ diphosphatase
VLTFSSERSARNTFAAPAIDRATERREQSEWLVNAHAGALELLISHDSLIGAHASSERLCFNACAANPGAIAQRWYLGQAAHLEELPPAQAAGEKMDYFARVVERSEHPELIWLDLRAVALKLPAIEAGLAAFARGLQFWHTRHQFCGVCGSATRSEHAGHRRRCVNPDCGAEHFPRTDPAIIVAVEFEGDILLGRQAGWPPGRYSTLAGFVEPGETLEDALVREVFEEAGVRVVASDYFSSQPWPFPASLMLGFTAVAATREVNVGPELEHARYFSLAQFQAAILDGSLKTPPAVSVSYRLIEHWYERQVKSSFAEFLREAHAANRTAREKAPQA